MPLTPEEPEIYESVPGTRASAGASRTPQASRTAAPVPGPRPAPRPAPPRTDSKGPNTPGRPNAPRQGNSPAQPKPGAQAKAAAKAQIQLVAATDATAVEVADETVDKLLDEGRSPGDILLLTTGAQHPWAEHELSFGEDAYWRQLTEAEDVFCAHASAVARTAQRPVVLLAVNGGTDPEAAAALPAALEKATEQLIVCGDPARLRVLL
ncbi:hypothetical protein ACH4LN_30845 [Streptomyces albus]|uniref:hypothetical protein n=1 Tax=Streptomyces TaxID=1883 RepID=UPI00034E4773|nr:MULTISPECIES: hypothetical protein [Streptomyces]EPD94111.1 hypothetical protein HMPREF1486_03401 [Streptomyces sp. HPH0547]QID38561.1 hypothetical protein G3260_005223 [Streptomyces albus]UVN54442.1 hypothetical protein NR995_07795 [Streptomyces albus]GHJ24929.1 hypothetical protein TPA0909_65430 [Streptomyces albus]